MTAKLSVSFVLIGHSQQQRRSNANNLTVSQLTILLYLLQQELHLQYTPTEQLLCYKLCWPQFAIIALNN